MFGEEVGVGEKTPDSDLRLRMARASSYFMGLAGTCINLEMGQRNRCERVLSMQHAVEAATDSAVTLGEVEAHNNFVAHLI